MNKKYFRIADVMSTCNVTQKFVLALERENLIRAIIRRSKKVYPLDQVDRIRVARILIKEMGVNLEGVEVVLHMREQIINMRREFDVVLTRMQKRF